MVLLLAKGRGNPHVMSAIPGGCGISLVGSARQEGAVGGNLIRKWLHNEFGQSGEAIYIHTIHELIRMYAIP